MGTFNRILQVMILLGAIAALVISIFLYQKRVELRNRGDKMAKVIQDVALALDAQSETNFADKLKPGDLGGFKANPETGVTPEQAMENMKRSIHHKNYNMASWLRKQKVQAGEIGPEDEIYGENLQRLLDPFLKQAQDIMQQRDSMGTTLKEVADNLELPTDVEAKDFFSVQTYQEKEDSLKELTAKVNERNNSLINYFLKTSDAIKKPIQDQIAFKESNKKLEPGIFTPPLEDLVSNAGKLKKRSDDYAVAISDVSKELSVTMEKQPNLNLALTTPTLDDISAEDGYENAIASVKNDATMVTDKLVQTKENLDITTNELNIKKEECAQLTQETLKQKKEIADLEKKIRILTGTDKEGDVTQLAKDVMPTPEALINQLEGEVIDYNKKWDFVVINLGNKSKIKQDLPSGKERELPAPLPNNRVMLISRGDKYIGKVRVFQVDDNFALANVEPGPRGGLIKVGDNVFFPPLAAVKEAGKASDGGDDAKVGDALDELGIDLDNLGDGGNL